MTNYQTTIQDLQRTVYRRGINYGLTHVQSALTELENPHLALPPTLHVAGTNGKGSTIAFLEGMLLESGYSVGKYTSPHIESYRERIQINQRPISEQDFVTYFNHVKQVETTHPLTEFEKLTFMAFLYFKDKKPDYVLLETGLGGRLDATNVVTPIASVITSIGIDHTELLGHTLPQIAMEKAGIIKPKVPVITCSQDPEVMTIIDTTAKKHQSSVVYAAPQPLPPHSQLQGSYQRINYGMAMTTITQLKIPLKTSISGKKIACWGRFTVIKRQNQTIIIDVAHNHSGIRALLNAYTDHFSTQRPGILCGFLKRKDILKSIPLLETASDPLYYCEFSNDAHPWDDVNRLFPTVQKWTLDQAFPENPIVIITGSIYFLSQIKCLLDHTGVKKGEGLG